MKVFLSWSGPVSKQVAAILREWLPNVIQAIEPWMSLEDIDKGSRWSSDIAKELLSTKAGIICVTSDNHTAPWLNFEAGALSKTVDNDMVCPFLFDLKPSDLTGPLVQFQAAEPTRDDLLRLLNTLNKGVAPKPLAETKLTEAFSVWWPKLEERFKTIVRHAPLKEATRPANEMIEEILSITREQSRATQHIVSVVEQTRMAKAFRSNYQNYNQYDRLLHLQGLISNPAPGIVDQFGQVRLKDFDVPIDDAGVVDGGEGQRGDEEGPIKPE